MNPFDAIQHVGTPLSLAAFIVAVGAWIYRAKLAEKRELVETAPEDDRAEIIESMWGRDFKSFSVQDLTKKQRYDLTLEILAGRQARFRMVAIASGVLAVALAVVVIATWGSGPVDLAVRLHGPGGPADLITNGSVLLDIGADRLPATVDSQGEARFKSLAPGIYDQRPVIIATAPGYTSVDSSIVLTERPQGDAVYVPMMRALMTVRGTVTTSSADHLPLDAVVVDVGAGAVLDTTDAGGHFSLNLPGAPGDQVAIRLVRAGRVGLEEQVTVHPDFPLVLRFDLGGDP